MRQDKQSRAEADPDKKNSQHIREEKRNGRESKTERRTADGFEVYFGELK